MQGRGNKSDMWTIKDIPSLIFNYRVHVIQSSLFVFKVELCVPGGIVVCNFTTNAVTMQHNYFANDFFTFILANVLCVPIL